MVLVNSLGWIMDHLALILFPGLVELLALTTVVGI